MATIQHEKFTARHPPRPQLQSQHSNSVPSTPYQQPRDLRFPTRSPSPRTLNSRNRSPRSIASEAGQPNGVPRSVPAGPVVCKFESGAEMRRRRFAYVDGGDQVLDPPKKEVKKTLDPDEERKLSGDMRALYDRLLPSEESDRRRAAIVTKLETIMHEEWPESDIRVAIFGSSGNLLSSSDSDVDICVTTSLEKLESMHSLAGLLSKNGMEKVVCRAAAKVPIVKCWDPELQLACDINVNNPLALENTRMIKTYVQLDDRIRPLAKIIKHWTKRRLLNDAAFGGTISSYTWICMIINFLQRREPPILPSLQKTPGKRSTIDGELSSFADDIDALKGCGNSNKESLAELLFQFFRHYGYEFDYPQFVVSVKEGRSLSRHEKGWDDPINKEARCRLCVEEPFNTPRNLGNSADDYSWNGIHRELRRACELLADSCQLDKCCEEFEFPPQREPALFVKPTPKPKPTLTRSASQTGGRSNHESGSGRRKGGNRNQSAQRAGNRRASSGAQYNNQRTQFAQSPSAGLNAMDYFAAKGNLHDQLYQQYQFLQAQQDALRSQLVAQQQSQQAQARVGDLAGITSPQHTRQIPNGMPSSRDNGPMTAPLMPNYYYAYPGHRFPPQSPLTQQAQRSREGTSTNPSSPSLVAAVPALRRQGHRASVPDGLNSSARSQSQPGRSFPAILTPQQQAQHAYEMEAHFQKLRMYGQRQYAGMQMPFSSSSGMRPNPTSLAIDTAMPKEYVGYYVGQSPQLGPQYATTSHMQMPSMPSMPSLRDPPQRQRRITPDLMPPTQNGRHMSRSPSPLGRSRGYSSVSNSDAARGRGITTQSPLSYESPSSGPTSIPIQEADLPGPLIVNGSNPPPPPKPMERVNGVSKAVTHHRPDAYSESDSSSTYSLPFRNSEQYTAESSKIEPGMPPSPHGKATPRLNLSPNGHATSTNGFSEPYPDTTPINAGPLLSPVAELRTPSPTRGKSFEYHHAPLQPVQVNGSTKPFKIADLPHPRNGENGKPSSNSEGKSEGKHERQNSKNMPPSATKHAAKSPTIASLPTGNGSANKNEKNGWQQAPGRKNHKSKSTAGGGQQKQKGQGEQLPVNENERKGG